MWGLYELVVGKPLEYITDFDSKTNVICTDICVSSMTCLYCPPFIIWSERVCNATGSEPNELKFCLLQVCEIQ